MKQLHIYISGFVQGVGFRRFVKREAEKRQVTGWVTNLSDRRVEAVLQGPESKLQEMIAVCQKGSYLSQVKTVSYDYELTDEVYTAFMILK